MEEKNTKQAKFWVANAMEAGDGGVVHRYWFTIDLSDAEFEELYQLWYNNNCELNSWNTDDKGHEALFEKLNGLAYHALDDLLKKNEPDYGELHWLDCHWEIAKETTDQF